jgi:hypothetical protein
MRGETSGNANGNELGRTSSAGGLFSRAISMSGRRTAWLMMGSNQIAAWHTPRVEEGLEPTYCKLSPNVEDSAGLFGYVMETTN